MSIKVRKSLPYRTGSLILFGATLLTVLLSTYFYQRTYQEQLNSANRQLEQLFGTVESSAAIAAYLENADMALEVVRGLVSNDIVSGARMHNSSGMNVLSGQFFAEDAQGLKHFPLQSPFMADENIGAISIQSNDTLIKERAREAAWVHVLIMSIHSFMLVVLAIFLIHRYLTQPLKYLAQNLHVIPPGSSQRLECPKRHQDDEIGLLIHDANELLTATQNTLEGERRLRIYAESLEKQFRLIFENASCGIALVDQQGKIILNNPSFRELMETDHNKNELSDIHFYDLFRDAGQVRLLLQKASTSNAPINCDLQLANAESAPPRWLNSLISTVIDDQGGMIVECILYDISERTQREQKTRFEAERDPLTQLFNRREGTRQIELALQHAKENSSECCIMLLDLDKFKPINDTYGHDAGDRVLISVAERLKRCLRKNDIVIRWGGDEFLIVIEHQSDINFIAEKLLRQLGEEIDLGNGVFDHIGASIGVSMFPAHGFKLESLVHCADQAMYQIKQSGRNNYAVFSPEMNALNNQITPP